MKKDILQIIFCVFIVSLIILFEFTDEFAWVKVIYNVFGFIWALFLCFIGGYLIFRCIKPVMKEYEVIEDDLREIKEQWNWNGTKGEPPIDYVYRYACRYERARIYGRFLFIIVAIFLIVFGIGAIYEII